MSRVPSPQRSLGITLRTALLSWLVTLMTLGLFIVFIVPQQKQTYVQGLESKAHGVAVSLRDVVAGAAINEDYSSVVDHCMEMLGGDSSLVYLVITRNDGFSLINDRQGWRTATDTGPAWRPVDREPHGGIGTVPLHPDRLYHYSQPFDYSGIEWGWLHVGLSLEAYEQNVSTLYRTTAVLGLVCTGLSLVASVLYAKRLVQPILALRGVVERVARGEFSARAPVHRGDEIGALSTSVNAMTDALLRRDRILGSVRRAAELFVGSDHWEHVIPAVLDELGTATGVSRIAVYRMTDRRPGAEQVRLSHQWVAPDLPPADRVPPAATFEPRPAGFGPWYDCLQRGEPVLARTLALENPIRRVLDAAGVKSIMVLPILVGNRLWGTVNLDDCQRDREWELAEQHSLRAAVDMFGATIARQRAQAALVEANNTLEQRVTERTRELVAEVEAKEQARAELAAAQQQLITTSRQAGMAEIASGVLHNVGNVLNSVNVSSALVSERLRESQLRSLARLAALVAEHRADFPRFVAEDPRGQVLADYLIRLSERLGAERDFLLKEHEQLTRNVEHIKDIVAMQQNYARMSGFLQPVPFTEVIEDALQINATGFVRHQIEIVREYRARPTVVIDKHKVLQICVNLIQNAKHALCEAPPRDRRLTLTLEQPGPDRIRFTVTDNGIGIPAGNLTRIFSHGFTTRSQGHGFGLHSGANHAREMGGSLTAASDGPGRGATFVLELPLTAPRGAKAAD